MQSTFVTAGIACLIAAAVGGGLQAFGITIPALNSLARQIILAVLGAVFLVAGISMSGENTSSRTPAETGRPSVSPPLVTSAPDPTATDAAGNQGGRPMDFYLKWNTVIPGPLLEQLRFPDGDYNSCLQACEKKTDCKAWVFGPLVLPAGVKFNCGLKLAVTGERFEQVDSVSGYSTRYNPAK